MAEQRGTIDTETAGALSAAIDAAEIAGFLPHGGVYGTLAMPDPACGALRVFPRRAGAHGNSAGKSVPPIACSGPASP